MIAIDTNIFVYAFRVESPFHSAAREAVDELASGGRRWAIPWPCVHEFLSVVSGPRMLNPTPTDDALAAIRKLVIMPRVVMLSETRNHLDILAGLIRNSSPRGPRVHDAKIAAICLGHGVDELWTADRDYGYFPALRTRNPLVSDDRR